MRTLFYITYVAFGLTGSYLMGMGIFDSPPLLDSPLPELPLDQSEVVPDEQNNLSPNLTYTCCVCSRHFATQRALNHHQKRIHNLSNNGPYSCPFNHCGKTFNRLDHLNRHTPKHTGQKPYTCTFNNCSKAFSTNYGLTKHAQLHTGQKPYICDFDGCNRSFARHDGLIEHTRVHTGQKPYECAECSKSFTQYSALWRHKKLKHPKPTEDPTCL